MAREGNRKRVRRDKDSGPVSQALALPLQVGTPSKGNLGKSRKEAIELEDSKKKKNSLQF